MPVLKLKPSGKDYLWGGDRLIREYGKEFDGDVLAETWELSCHPDGPSYIMNGPYEGKTLAEYIEAEGKGILGKNCRRFRDFPILTKFIDAKDSLSIQVHPDNKYALKNEGQYGKTEMWYVMDAGEDAYLYYGFAKEIAKEEFAKRIEEDTLTEVLNKVPVQKGDVLFIEAGTIHAIGKDILIAEIQQNSNVTYRVYDYGRVGKDGKKRDLHIEKALAVTNRVPMKRSRANNSHIADCDYFTVDKLTLDGCVMKKMEGVLSEDSFVSILILEGNGTISCGSDKLEYKKGESFFLPAGSGTYEIEGCCEALLTRIREKAAPIRIGVAISAAGTKIGLIDVHQQIVAQCAVETDVTAKPDEMICLIGRKVMELLEQEEIPVDQCVSVGVGVPGTVDQKTGRVLYSNNIPWKNVELKAILQEVLPLPVFIANDADCAILGEAAGGAARGYDDVLMLTLGTGVGGGVILDGKIYNGKMLGGSELGHMVIVEDGEPCTCGRKGCLEAYVSKDGLLREARKIMERYPDSLLWTLCGGEKENCRQQNEKGQMSDKQQNKKGQTSGQEYDRVEYALCPEDIFEAARRHDIAAVCVLDGYTKHLASGIVNLVNIFRPQLVLIGGGLSGSGEYLLAPLRGSLVRNCFGGGDGELPELAVAVLGNDAAMLGAANLGN